MVIHMSGRLPEQRKRMWAMYIAMSKLLFDIVDLHPNISKAYVRSDDFHKHMLYLWTTSDNVTKNAFFIDWDHPENDGVTQLTLRVVEDLGGRRGLLRQSNNFTQKAKTYGPPCPPEIRFPEGLRRMATGLVHRAIKMREAIEDPAKFMRGMVTYIGRLMQIVERLCEADDDELYAHLLEANYLTELALALHSSIIALGTSPSQEYLDIVLDGCAALTRIVGRQETAVSRNWRYIVEGKIIPSLAHVAVCIPPVPSFDTQRRILNSTFNFLSTATLYPRVLDSLLATPGLIDTHEVSQDLRRSSTAAIWDPFWDTLQFRLKVYWQLKKQPSLGLCDNPQCSQNVREMTRACAGCSAVVYCSGKCQYLDWIRLHRKECRFMRDHHRKERSTKTWYSHRTRAFHTKLLEASSPTVPSLTQSYQPAKAPVPVLDFCHKPPDGGPKSSSTNSPVVTYDMKDGTTDHWMRRPGTDFTQKYLTPRLRALGRQVAPGVQEGEYKTVEGRFPLADGVVVNTLVVLMKEKEGYEATYSIPRHG
ncbi:hypothetical protein FA13DRAFT_1325653 [Coprinellus micaceus]|uniref:phytol kinase n=1 Tax=Coprinellus micaceus TaxID=71717 RepID=A0A4Y7SR48_COPMI|nr:hypothetical protein FA13DRAFT_1325653 [Coprinellus micaceus]